MFAVYHNLSANLNLTQNYVTFNLNNSHLSNLEPHCDTTKL